LSSIYVKKHHESLVNDKSNSSEKFNDIPISTPVEEIKSISKLKSKPKLTSKPNVKMQLQRQLPTANEILIKIEEDFLNPEYVFNVASLPVETLYPNKDDDYFAGSYAYFVQRNVKSWNEIFPRYFGINSLNLIQYAEIRPIYIIKTIKDFVFKTNVGVIYDNKLLVFQVTYYGSVEPTQDPFREDTVYSFQMIDIRYVPTMVTLPGEVKDSMYRYSIPTTMSEQLDYVGKINQMHCEENLY
jgi:hypothetical protein